LPVFRRRASSPAPHFTLPGGPVFAIVGALLCMLFLANSSMRELLDVTVALVIGFAGFVYAKFTKPG
jgi:hypothetical protein